MAANEQHVEVTVEGQLDLSKVEFDAGVPLRVAAVRNGEILASQDLRARKGSVAIKLPVRLPSPCGFRLLVGRADVPDAVFAASELVSVQVPPQRKVEETTRAARARATAALTVDVGRIEVEASRYSLWLLSCRRFRVHGRVVCRSTRWNGRRFVLCEDPVPGATVEIYDVDCFWWFCRRDLITTVVTAPDGTFDAEFLWCCPPWRPWLEPPFVIDPDLLDRIRRLLAEARPRFPIPLPYPHPDPLEFQPFLDTLGTSLQFEAQSRTQLATAAVAPLPETEIARLLPAEDLVARHVWPWWPSRDCRPDIVFRVTQHCRDTTEVIYEESNLQARWNVPDTLGVTLVANDKACCIPVCEDDPCGDCFKFGQVGCTRVELIGGNDPTAPVGADLLGFAYPGTSDIAFAETMAIYGAFGDLADVDYYEIEYSQTGAPASFNPVPQNQLGGFTRSYWGPPCGTSLPPQFNHPTFVPKAMQDTANLSHLVYESRQHFEAGCAPFGPTRLWTAERDRIFDWITSNVTTKNVSESPLVVPNGLYYLRVVGWKDNGAGKLTSRQVMTRCDTVGEEHLLLRLDNRAVPNHPVWTPEHPWGPGSIHFGTVDPDCHFSSIVKNEGTDNVHVGPCDIVELADTDTLTIHFFVTVPSPPADRHLGGYYISAHYGESHTFDMIARSVGSAPQADPTPVVGPTYTQALAQGLTEPLWRGGSYKLVLDGSQFKKTCAYLFRLHAWKRVFNGCYSISWFHWNDTEVSITIKKR